MHAQNNMHCYLKRAWPRRYPHVLRKKLASTATISLALGTAQVGTMAQDLCNTSKSM